MLELLASGAGREEILADYPYLESGDVTAALGFDAQHEGHLTGNSERG
ncbi:MAG: DUF433 domain-containing protein [Vicinamibacterales bacterium]